MRIHQGSADALAAQLPAAARTIGSDQGAIPRLAKDAQLLGEIEQSVQRLPTHHKLYRHDARDIAFLPDESVHLVVTSPPYWTLKEYRRSEGQLGYVADYECFLDELDRVWKHCYRVLVPGGRLVIVVGDVCLSRRQNNGRHTVVPLHASIQEHCRAIGYDNLAPILWYKIANAAYEAKGNGGGFLGKPFEPNSVIKNDVEFILMQRKSGGYRTPSIAARIMSVISGENHKLWFQQVWGDVPGASTREHPAPYPVELAARLVRMFSFVGDTVLDPFMGTGSTTIAALRWGRNSVGVEIDTEYLKLAEKKIVASSTDTKATVEVVGEGKAPRYGSRSGSKGSSKKVLASASTARKGARSKRKKGSGE